MQNSYQQTPYTGNQPYAAVPHQPRVSELSSNDTDDEKAAPANFHPSPNKDSIYIPFLKRRVSRKTFWIICGCVGAVILIIIIVGVAVGVSNSKKGKNSKSPYKGGGKGRGNGKSQGFDNGGNDAGFVDDSTSDSSFTNTDDSGTDSSFTNTEDSGTDSSFTPTDDGTDYDPYATDPTSSGGEPVSVSGDPNDPCQQLLDAGASWPEVSDCLYQQHVTTMMIIDNFDGVSDYDYTYTYNPYGGTKKEGKPIKAANRKLVTGLKLESAGRGLSGKASQFHGNLGSKGSKKPTLHPLKHTANVKNKIKTLKPLTASSKSKVARGVARNAKLARTLKPIKARSVDFKITPKVRAAYSFLQGSK